MSAFLIFPHQLFEETLAQEADVFYVVESNLFFKQYAFHKQKLIFHRASMRAFADRLRAAGKTVEYIDAQDPRASEVALVSSIEGAIMLFDPNDYLLERRLRRTADIRLLASPNFLNTDTSLLGTRKPYFQTAFYTQQRKDRRLLLEEDGKPMGGQWTFDADNRKKIPKNTFIPAPFPETPTNKYILEAIDYVYTYFPANPGSSEKPFSGAYYPVTHAESQAALDLFLRERMHLFGDYEDAIKAQEKTLFHSILSPLINVGLLNPADVVARVAACDGPLNSVEGFIRQIIGWREFVQLLYRKISVQQRTTNYWGFTNEMPAAFYDGTTGLEPIDQTIRKLLKTGYNHHIERLMVLGNFMLLCEIKPDAVYRWFMEMYIDAYDWVMVPNVYGMSQFSDGGLMTTKPYICGSNYILKMSDYPKGEWQEIWDGLFWRFLDKQRETFRKNPRWAMIISTWDKMPVEKREAHLLRAETFLTQLFA
ncbi:cryptochrome/photolyase family protein [Aquirufa sp.]|jgi:deoxyribodipyrimidine photolyase-related protein|uniref:cryptochrome/photolyase family protein n=1 Tax=Aquirufa sp. TaxID=2676249 RepID=UPI0037BE6241